MASEAIWTQIAERFKDKDETLLFEIFNEAHLMTADQLNTMNAAILPIIRKQNPTRVVLLQGLKFSNPTWFIQNPDALVVPADSQLMIEIHNVGGRMLASRLLYAWCRMLLARCAHDLACAN